MIGPGSPAAGDYSAGPGPPIARRNRFPGRGKGRTGRVPPIGKCGGPAKIHLHAPPPPAYIHPH